MNYPVLACVSIISYEHAGNDNIHLLAADFKNEVRFDLEDNGESRYATYSEFYVTSEAHKYRLTIDGYSGDAGGCLLSVV